MKKIIAFVIMWGLAIASFAAVSPVSMLEQAANHIITTLQQNKASLKHNPQIIKGAVERYLLPIVDVNGMSRSVLGREAWNKASVQDRQDFAAAFTQLVIRTYARPLSEYSDEKVRFLPVRAMNDASRFVRVNSIIIRTNGPQIPLSYSLVSHNGGWKIYDFSVEGVSLLQSFNSQFKQALQHSTVRELIADMRNDKKGRI